MTKFRDQALTKPTEISLTLYKYVKDCFTVKSSTWYVDSPTLYGILFITVFTTVKSFKFVGTNFLRLSFFLQVYAISFIYLISHDKVS